MIKKLVLSNLEESLKFIRLKQRNSGTTPTTEEKFYKEFEKYFHDGTNRYAFGYFHDNVLQSFMCIGFFENKLRGKFWVVSSYYSKIFRTYFSWGHPEAGLLLKHVIEFAEEKKYYEWYYAVSSRIEHVFERQWKKNPYAPIGRYDLIKLDTVKKNTKPSYELYWKLMGEELKPDDMIIKKRILKKEHRSD